LATENEILKSKLKVAVKSKESGWIKLAKIGKRIPKNFRPFYCLRHTFASIAASNDVPERVLKALVGHSHIEARKEIQADTLIFRMRGYPPMKFINIRAG
jgi:integrase